MVRKVTFLLLIMFAFVSVASAQTFRNLNFDKNLLIKSVKFKGKFILGRRWIDKNGENILILTQTGPFPSKTHLPDERDAELFAYHYIREGNNFRLLWKIYDFERNCPLDMYVGFEPKSLSITDLDKNGIAESCFIYKLSCRGDVSPSRMKLIMHEGKQKLAIRGTTIIQTPTGKFGGERKVDPSFKNAPKIFEEDSLKKWDQFVKETWKQF